MKTASPKSPGSVTAGAFGASETKEACKFGQALSGSLAELFEYLSTGSNLVSEGTYAAGLVMAIPSRGSSITTAIKVGGIADLTANTFGAGSAALDYYAGNDVSRHQNIVVRNVLPGVTLTKTPVLGDLVAQVYGSALIAQASKANEPANRRCGTDGF